MFKSDNVADYNGTMFVKIDMLGFNHNTVSLLCMLYLVLQPPRNFTLWF